jgi:hypothetical protein
MRVTSKGQALEFEFEDWEYHDIERFAALEGQSVEQWVGEVIRAKFQQLKHLNDRKPAPVIDLRTRRRDVAGTK